jgi:NADH-quinone oxidoreductase subunit I
MKQRKQSYLGSIVSSFHSLLDGLQITLSHILRSTRKRTIVPITDPKYFSQPAGISTIQYPHEMILVPDNGRYRLHNEIDDCIVCDKCAKICPVNCIEIEPIRAVEEIGKTSDGTPKRIYAAKFDIDMAKCCFCGLCTTVCPTECLTMTKVFDFSVTDIHDHNFAFAEMSPAEIEEKKNTFEAHQKSKLTTTPVVETKPLSENPEVPKPVVAKPMFRPKIKPPGSQAPPTTP